MSVAYSCMIPLGVGFARTAEIAVKALEGEGLLGQLFTGEIVPQDIPFKDAVHDSIVAAELEPCKVFHGWANASFSSMLVAKGFGAKRVLERQSSHVSVQKTLTGAVDPLDERRMLREYQVTDVILVPSRLVEESFLEADPPLKDKLVRIPLGVDGERFKRMAQFRHKFRLLFVANNFDRKGGIYLVKAWELARRMSKNAREGSLWIVGEAPRGELGPGINPLGWLQEDEYVRTVQEADVLALPSLEEGFGLVVLEMMSSGHPVIVSENVGAKDCLSDGREGFIVPVGEPMRLAKAIVSLADYPDRRQDMGEQAHRSAMRFTWSRYKQSYLELVRSLL